MEPIIRHSAPSKLDHASFQTECLVFVKDHIWDVYVQYGKEDDPRWEYIGRRVIEESEDVKR